MFVLAALATLLGLASAAPTASTCTYEKKVAGIQYEIDTISSHSVADANKIPLSTFASRTFIVTPAEFHGAVVLPPINVGVTATTVRDELVALGTVLQASVPPKSVHYIQNTNGSVTVDFIQLDGIALPREHVREIHYFNDDCEITKILGYVNGPLECPQPKSANSTFLKQLCSELKTVEKIG